MSYPFGDLLSQYRARQHGLSQTRLAGYEAARLFVECARFTLTAKNALTVRQIVTRLDGIPLAIERPAARVSGPPRCEAPRPVTGGLPRR